MTDHDQKIADEVGQRLGRFLFEMQEATDWPTWVILAGAHAHVTGLMLQNMGPQDAAAICERAGQRIRDLSPLAFAAPAGRA